tara:strand:+ start:318 stop:629 length:312 start_codon:yes stop_codon:yes gene_type:complete
MSETTNPYVLNKTDDGQAVIDKALGKLIGQTVCVSYTTTRNEKMGDRKNFEPQISVQALLEGSEETGKYRVLIDDNTYSYFYNDSVWSMCQDVGKRAIVFISG